MIHITDKRQCSGCKACSEICPKNCISIITDNEGFWYPNVNRSICIDCGLCERICPQLVKKEPVSLTSCLAAKSLENSDVDTSSSGGIFVQMAKWILKRGGIVFGVEFNEKWDALFTGVEDLAALEKLKTSKYVQADTNGVFSKIKSQLVNRRWVLFVATPCQIKALHLFLGKNYPTLLTADIICHGVPSPFVWQRYLMYRIKLDTKAPNKFDILSVNFRDKRISWEKHCLTIKYFAKNKKNIVSYSASLSDDFYIRLFESNVILRPSCYDCHSKGGTSGSDITIGDFWGIDLINASFNDHRGCSLVIANTLLGRRVVSELNLNTISVDPQLALRYNPSYYESSIFNPSREVFFKLLLEHEDFGRIKGIIFPPLNFMQRIQKSISIKFNRFLSK